MLELSIISDIHHGPDRGTKKGSEAQHLFANFSEWLSSQSPDLVVDLGDRISDVDRDTDKALVAEVGSWFSQLPVPRFHLAGNHDLKELTLEENEELLGVSLRSRSLDIKNIHLVFWNANARLDHEAGFSISEEELQWLQRDLAETDLPSVVFTHIPLDNGSMVGNFYFENAHPHHAYYNDDDGRRIRDVLERSEKVILCLNGHTHWNAYHCVDGIHYVTLPSLTETFPTYPDVCRSWTRLSIKDDIHIQVLGNLPVEYRLPLRKPGAGHWVSIDKEYAPQVSEPQ